MCGTAGLFVGCPLASVCPRQVLLGDRDVDPTETPAEYRSPFAKWDQQASVRRTERRTIAEGFRLLDAFPDELTPVLRAPVLDGLDPHQRGYLKVQQLYRFLDFTAKLEQMVVNRAALSIANDAVGVPLPEQMRFDAYRIYVDEAYHALFSADMMRQVEGATGVEPRLPAQPYFMRRLAELVDEHPRHAALVELLFVIVSETLITGALSQLGHSGDVDDGVIAMMRDHARDEGRHHAYFKAFAQFLWCQLADADKRVTADVLPELIVAFTSPEPDAVRQDLRHVGVPETTARLALGEVYSTDAVTRNARASSVATVSYFTELGVMRYADHRLHDFAQLAAAS